MGHATPDPVPRPRESMIFRLPENRILRIVTTILDSYTELAIFVLARPLMKAILSALAIAATLSPVAAIQAASYPEKTIRVIVPYAAGGSDLYIRPLQERLQEKLGQPVVIENVGGAGGIVGSTRVANSDPDGYTVLFGGSGAIVTAPKITGATYTWQSFEPVANLVAIPFMLVSKEGSSIKTFSDFVKQAKAQPGKLTYASPGHGTSTQMAADAMAAAAGISVTEVPYQGGAPATAAILGGHVDTAVATPSIAMPQVKAGKLIALAVTSGKRFSPTPDVPTLKEDGVDVAVVARYGFYMPKGTPKDIVTRFADAVAYAIEAPGYIDQMKETYNEVEYLGPAAYAKAVAEEDAYFTKLMKEMNMPIKSGG